ncbi:MAG TPA: amidase [Acidimicrobiales bacterium]|nr:amidase [Acidimicrobiales bacterium]
MSATPLTVKDAAAALRAGEVTSVALTQAAIDRAERLDKELGTYIVRGDDAALAAAAAADAKFAAGVDDGPLQGIPVGVKDIVATADAPTTCQSLVMDPEWCAGEDAPVVARLRAAGAVITGKTTTMEFAIGTPDFSKPFPIPRNPWNTECWAGGSSSGTGNGVAAGLFFAGIGTDTGGSIRIPSAFCGVTGLMPTYGRVPKSGVFPLGYSLDHTGPLARGAWDCAAMLDVLAGYDATDPYCSQRPVDDYVGALTGSVDGLRIGVVRAFHFAPDDDPSVVAAFDAAVAQLGDLGARVTEIVLPYYLEITAAMLVTMCAEAFAIHRRDMASRWDDYFENTRQIVALGALFSGSDYVQAQRVRRVAQRALAGLFSDVDVILTPTATVGSPTYAAMEASGPLGLLAKVHTGYWDAVGNPVLALPIGFTSEGLPLSMQLAGRPFDEATILRAGDAYQSATDWHVRIPPMAQEVQA